MAGYAPTPGPRTPHAMAYEMSPLVYHACDGRRAVTDTSAATREGAWPAAITVWRRGEHLDRRYTVEVPHIGCILYEWCSRSGLARCAMPC